ncbi:TetR/AcrR family transcriptional regulator [Luteimonas sp. BDR2-5]|uniref:TetR/AcrR family transcriptional regulator n=1 Tax=Proluteimonas luteida TaxID=2878685 RepID=UPI001E2CA407|nr:TetR/AcrR family transcriptional regulator [Luteimonas sp. BDR2-5]MCD9029756.1 TetR/AcrR family transcriptional regulator [Luteimonas sp. BDR2-5]
MATPPRPRAPARRPGRPSGDGDRRAAALDAALACYVRRGIAASSLREIAREAGVTPALLHYYFHDTAGLRDAVIAERLMPVFAEVRDTLLGMPDAPLRTVLTAFVDAICGLIARHAWLPPLWIREVVSEGGSLRGLLVTRLAPEISAVMAARIAAEQAAGRLNPGLDPRLLMVSLVGLTLFPAAGMPVWRQLFDSDALGIDDIRSHALALIERGLELPQ